MTWLDTTAMVPIGPRAYYVIRFEHELTLRFSEDPAAGYDGRTVRVELPQGIGTLSFELRPDRPPFLRGDGAPTRMEETLMDAVKLALHPGLGRQPSMP